ncbi:MAG: hypothetical protein KME06_17150 [Kastovskya adunca ATA6-11-RM4]|jgi:hypothetical protein|nr:hypothetical protein [Kastovskya adunca ATA6-11-RM4]
MEVLFSAEVIGNIVGAILSFLFGILVAYASQILGDRRRRVQITYSRKIEIPLTLAREELKNKLKIYYENTEVDTLYFFNLKIANTGKIIVKNQIFRCVFAEGTTSIDPTFPKISTIPKHEVGPVIPDQDVNRINEYRYTIETLGVGQIVSIDFLTVGNKTSDFEVIFKPNQEVNFLEKNVISESLTLENHLFNVITSLPLFYVVVQTASLIPFIGGGLGAIAGLPIILNALRSLPSVISFIVQSMQHPKSKYNINIATGTDISIGDNYQKQNT